jgi:hypothetical protein
MARLYRYLVAVGTATIALHAGSWTPPPAMAQPANAANDAALATDTDTLSPLASSPWHRDVSSDDKQRAKELYDAGNALNDAWHESYDNALLAQAVTLYRQALVYWQHPSIQLNLAHTLILLHREAAAYETLVLAVRFGPEPLESETDYRWAQNQIERLETLLAVVDVRCYQPDVRVSLDGQALFDSPRAVEKHLLPGRHTIVAERDGFLTETSTLELQPGQRRTVLFSLISLQDTTVSRRRHAIWKPWSVVGAGAAVVTAGSLLRWRAALDYDRFDREFTAMCQTAGCTDDQFPALQHLRGRARWENRFGVGGMVLGGLAVLSGTVWALINQPTNSTVREPGILIAPALAPNRLDIAASWRF